MHVTVSTVLSVTIADFVINVVIVPTVISV